MLLSDVKHVTLGVVCSMPEKDNCACRTVRSAVAAADVAPTALNWQHLMKAGAPLAMNGVGYECVDASTYELYQRSSQRCTAAPLWMQRVQQSPAAVVLVDLCNWQLQVSCAVVQAAAWSKCGHCKHSQKLGVHGA